MQLGDCTVRWDLFLSDSPILTEYFLSQRVDVPYSDFDMYEEHSESDKDLILHNGNLSVRLRLLSASHAQLLRQPALSCSFQCSISQ